MNDIISRCAAVPRIRNPNSFTSVKEKERKKECADIFISKHENTDFGDNWKEISRHPEEYEVQGRYTTKFVLAFARL